MRIRMELHPDVASDLKDRFRADEDSFYERLRAVRDDPLKNSELYVDPAASRYCLRCFRFGRGVEKIAIFEYDLARSRIRVIQCRLSKRGRARRGGGGESGRGVV